MTIKEMCQNILLFVVLFLPFYTCHGWQSMETKDFIKGRVAHLMRDDTKSNNRKPPIWPLQWNATLIKIGPEKSPTSIRWTKFYYDWTNSATRFDFMESYLSLSLSWTANFTILFKNTTIYHIYPLEKKCTIRSRSIPTINPHWLKTTTYHGTYLLKGIWCDLFVFDKDPDLTYWQRASDLTPVRSTNQANDPGATDYVDVVLGPQNQTYFEVPAYCPP